MNVQFICHIINDTAKWTATMEIPSQINFRNKK